MSAQIIPFPPRQGAAGAAPVRCAKPPPPLYPPSRWRRVQNAILTALAFACAALVWGGHLHFLAKWLLDGF